MFDARIRLLIIDNSSLSAAMTRNRIVSCQRSNIWTIQCCSYDTASKVIQRGNICFDMILVNATQYDSTQAMQLITSFRKICDHQILLGLCTIDHSPTVNNNCGLDFIWTNEISDDKNNTQHQQLKNLLAFRHLKSIHHHLPTMHLEQLTISTCNVFDLKFSVFSYPIGYRFLMEKLM
jgi:hypothetical protein